MGETFLLCQLLDTYLPIYKKKLSTLCTYVGMYRERISSAIDYLTASHFEKKIHHMLNGDLGVGTSKTWLSKNYLCTYFFCYLLRIIL